MMKDKMSPSRLHPRRPLERARDSSELRSSQSKPSLRLWVRLSNFVTTPSPTSARDAERVIAHVGGIGIHQGQAASQSEPTLASEHFFSVTNPRSSPLSASPFSATVFGGKPLPPSPSQRTPITVDVHELPGSILLKNQGLLTAQDRRQLRVSCETPAPLRTNNAKLEYQASEFSRRSEESVTSQSTNDSPFTKSPASEFEVSPITLHSETASPSSPYLSLGWRAKAGSSMSGKADTMDNSAGARRGAASLEQRVIKLERKLKERDSTIRNLHQELDDVKAGRQEHVQSSQTKESHMLHQTGVLTLRNDDGLITTKANTANQEQDEVRQLRYMVQQKNIQISILEEEILRWKDDIDHLENKIRWFIELLREPSNQETFQSRAFCALENELLEEEFIIQPLRPRKRAASEHPDPENIPLPPSPAEGNGEDGEPPSPSETPDDTSKSLQEALVRIEELEAKVKFQTEDIRLYKLDVRGYKKDVREGEEKIKRLQREILDLQRRVGSEESEVLLSDVPLGIDLGGDMIMARSSITSSAVASGPTSSAPVSAQEPALEPQPVPQEVPKAPIPESPTPEPRRQQQQQQPNRAPRQQTHSRTSTRTRFPRCDPIIEETTLPDSPTLAEAPIHSTRRWRQCSPRDLHEAVRVRARRAATMISMSSVMEDSSKEGGKGGVQTGQQQGSQMQSQQPEKSQLHDPFI